LNENGERRKDKEERLKERKAEGRRLMEKG